MGHLCLFGFGDGVELASSSPLINRPGALPLRLLLRPGHRDHVFRMLCTLSGTVCRPSRPEIRVRNNYSSLWFTRRPLPLANSRFFSLSRRRRASFSCPACLDLIRFELLLGTSSWLRRVEFSICTLNSRRFPIPIVGSCRWRLPRGSRGARLLLSPARMLVSSTFTGHGLSLAMGARKRPGMQPQANGVHLIEIVTRRGQWLTNSAAAAAAGEEPVVCRGLTGDNSADGSTLRGHGLTL